MPFSAYLRATANSLDKVKRSLLLLGNMAAKMSVNRPAEGDEEVQSILSESISEISLDFTGRERVT